MVLNRSCTFTVCFFLFSYFCFSQTVSLDSNFGTSGKVEIGFGNTFVLKDIKISTGNFIYVLGQITENEVVKTLVIKFTPSGNLDVTFGDNGILETTFAPLNNFIPSVLNFTDNKIIIAGTYIHTPNAFFSREPMLIRLTDLGILDTTFGNNGYFMIDVNSNPTVYRYQYGESIFSLNTFQNNDILLNIPCSGVIVGQSSQNKSILIRMNSAGEIISNFGTNGVLEISTHTSFFIYDDEILSNENFVILGVNSGSGMFRLYDSTGSFIQNHNFQVQGLYSFLNLTSTDSNVFAIGNTLSSNYIIKFNSSLQQDLNFGINGILNVPHLGKIKATQNRVFNVVGSINNNHMFKVFDYFQNGELNTNFGDNGVFDISFGNNTHLLKSIFYVESNKLLMVGTHGDNLALCRIVFETLSVEGFDNSNFVNVYPNPTQNLLNIHSEKNIESVSIYNTTGQLLKEYSFDDSIIQINIESLSTGIYFVKINANNKSQTVKITKK